jgi:hypothetical protein
MTAMMRGFALVLTIGTLVLAGCTDTSPSFPPPISVKH